jgi:hypothetical protein
LERLRWYSELGSMEVYASRRYDKKDGLISADRLVERRKRRRAIAV